MSKTLGKNPLFATEPAVEETAPATQIEETEELDEYMTMSFKVRRSLCKKLRDYAYTNRLEIQGALDEILTGFFDNIDLSTLLEAPEKTKKSRKKV